VFAMVQFVKQTGFKVQNAQFTSSALPAGFRGSIVQVCGNEVLVDQEDDLILSVFCGSHHFA
jgi:hypothetical protein